MAIGNSMAIVFTLKPATSSGAKFAIVRSVLRVRQHSGNARPKSAGAEIERIERRPEVDVKRIIDGSGEYPDAATELIDPLPGEIFVVGHGPRADVGRNGK